MAGRPIEEAQIKAAEAVALGFKRTINMYRLYGVQHELAKGAESQLLEGVAEATDAGGALTLDVQPVGLACHGEVVLPDGDKDESLSRVLLTDGVEAITLQPPVEPSEMQTLVRTWFLAASQSLTEEHSFATIIWEKDMQSVQVRFRSDLAESGVADSGRQARQSHLARVFAGLTAKARSSASVRVEVDALSVIRAVPAFATLTPDVLAEQAAKPRAALEPLSAVDRANLVSGLAAGGRGSGQRTLLGLWHVLCRAGDAEQFELLELVRSILGTLICAGRTVEVVRAFRRIEDRAAAPAERRRVQPVFGLLAEPALSAAVVAQLEDAALADDAMALLALIPAANLDELVAHLDAASAPVRARLASHLEGRRPKPTVLAGWILDHGAETAQALLRVADRLSAHHRDLALRSALIHDDPVVRAHAARSVRTEEVGHHRTLLLEVMRVEDPSVRQAVLQSLIRAKEPVVAEMLARTLAKEPEEGPMVRMAVQGLAAVGGERARQALLHAFREARHAELRKASALALAAVADAEVISALEAESKRLLGDRDVKEACKEALRRVHARQEVERE